MLTDELFICCGKSEIREKAERDGGFFREMRKHEW